MSISINMIEIWWEVDPSNEQEGAMTSVTMASHPSSVVLSARTKARAKAPPLGPRFDSAVPLIIDDEDLDDLAIARGIGLSVLVGLALWVVVGSVAWLLLA